MEIRPHLAVALLIFMPAIAFSQSDSTATLHFKYFNSFRFGVLVGENQDRSLSIAMHHGLRKDRFAFGVGLGYDEYKEWAVVPLSIMGMYDIVSKDRVALFLAADVGYAKAWPKFDHSEMRLDSDGGIMFNPMGGVRLRAGRCSIYVVAGYRFQRIGYSLRSVYDARQIGPGWNGYDVQRDIQRVQIQIGFGFN